MVLNNLSLVSRLLRYRIRKAWCAMWIEVNIQIERDSAEWTPTLMTYERKEKLNGPCTSCGLMESL